MKSYPEKLASQFLHLILLFNFILLFFLVGQSFSIFKPLLIDESITYWLVGLDYQQLIDQVYFNQGSSPLYFLTIKFFANLFGNQSTSALKLFSLVLATITFWYIYRLFRLNFSVVISSTMIAFLLGIKLQLTLTILPIRPYSLGVLFLAMGTYCYAKDLTNSGLFSKSKLYLLLTYTAFFLASVCHYFLIVIWLGTIVHYCLYNWSSKDRNFFVLYNLFLLALLALFMPHFQHIIENTSGWAQKLESNQSLLYAFIQFVQGAPYSISTILVLSLILFFKNFKKQLQTKQLNNSNYCLLTYSLLGFCLLPVIFYLLKTFLDLQVYVHRYYFWYVVLGAILVAYLLRFIEQSSKILVLFCGIIFTTELLWNETRNAYRLPDFQEASSIINNLNRTNLPVLFNPGLVETYDPKLLFDDRKKDYFYSHLEVYPINNQIRFLLPPNLEQSAFSDYFYNQILPILNSQKEFLIYTSAIASTPIPQALPIPEFYYILFQKLGWELKILNNDIGVAVIHLKQG